MRRKQRLFAEKYCRSSLSQQISAVPIVRASSCHPSASSCHHGACTPLAEAAGSRQQLPRGRREWWDASVSSSCPPRSNSNRAISRRPIDRVRRIRVRFEQPISSIGFAFVTTIDIKPGRCPIVAVLYSLPSTLLSAYLERRELS